MNIFGFYLTGGSTSFVQYAAVDALENIRHTKNDLMRNALVDGDFDTAMKRSQMYKESEKHRYEETCNLLNKEVK